MMMMMMIDDHKCQQSLDKKGLIYNLNDHLYSFFWGGRSSINREYSYLINKTNSILIRNIKKRTMNEKFICPWDRIYVKTIVNLTCQTMKTRTKINTSLESVINQFSSILNIYIYAYTIYLPIWYK